ncbi:MAG: cytochrome c oxidase subunit I [SAR202 cluster bacterium]|nr:cytochrome c oxidase subunit I [SAR202 cluster bacterium]
MTSTAVKFPTFIARPRAEHGLWSWITTIDHKRIGTLYGVTAFVFFLIGGVEALIMRTQLMSPENDFVSPEVYNQLFTMHGTTMVFLVIMPLSAAFFNWLIPLQIGARDVAFPRLNAFSYWLFLFGGILLNVGWLTGEAPNAGWFSYANLTEKPYSIGHGVTYWILGLQVLGVASLAASFNFIITIVNLRAPGMSFMKLPVFVWMTLVVGVLIIFAFPIITVALIQIQFDRLYGLNFFRPEAGGDPVMWQHMFWLFGHPEVYILILPAMGIVSEVLPTFSRKPLFGYPFVVFAGVSIAFMGFFVWSHHMFTVGLGPAATAAFSLSTMAIAVPTGIKIFNWVGTMYKGHLRLNTAMLFAIGFVTMFVVGGMSGVTHASPPTDAQQQDTYYIVAHFHYVLFGGSMLGLFSGAYYWWPKFTGRFLNEKIGQVHFWLMLVGFNLTFFPMHWLGLDGMPRRIFTYATGMGWDSSNYWATIGSYLIAVAVLVFIFNVFYSRKRGAVAGADPWDGRTLEWTIPSPPPEYNFKVIPHVKYRDDFWYTKHPELVAEMEGHGGHGSAGHKTISGAADMPPGITGEHGDTGGHGVHMPDKSYYPILVAAGLTFGVGTLLIQEPVILRWILPAIGFTFAFVSGLGWAFEPVNEPAAANDGH